MISYKLTKAAWRAHLAKNTIFKNGVSYGIAMGAIILEAVFMIILQTGALQRYYDRKYYHPSVVEYTKRPPVVVRFGYVTDAHSQTINGKIIPQALLPMQEFNRQMKVFQPDFVIDGGDFIDGTHRFEAPGVNDFKTLDAVLHETGLPAYHVLGNHDLRGFSRQRWLELTGNEAAYYYFDVKKNRFIVLDGNYIPHAGFDEPVEPGKSYTRGYVSREQMLWLEELLKQSRKKRLIVFLHQPPLQSTTERSKRTSFPVKSQDLMALFTKYRVQAVFSGHIEEKFHERINGVEYFVVPGFLKDSDKKGHEKFVGVFTEIEASKDIKARMYFKNETTGQYESIGL